ncbi:hypothetical protein [Clostridium scatologenes]|uniref:Resolvase n=1 Tax=Clostridium scatologenes TaxID=1548 RepID=A0A0E3M565_CLOSL|nr:hypothetical protein [Clostridium scatologenes]AKA68113.1 resolvase [Clostridium scatologenes]
MPYCLYLRKSRADINNKIDIAEKNMKTLINDFHFQILKNEKVTIPKTEKYLNCIHLQKIHP